MLEHLKAVCKEYPDMSMKRLGLTVLTLGAIRASLGYEGVASTVRDYIHAPYLTKDVRQCLDFLEREILAIKRSRVDIDYWKTGNKGAFRAD